MGLVGSKLDKNSETLDFNGRQLQKLPGRISQCEKLVILKCSNNQLRELPMDIAKLIYLRHADMDMNQFVEFPGILCSIKYLTVLNIAFNFISTLPSNMKQLTGLIELNLSNNELVELPGEIGYLENLQILNCAMNKLEGLPNTLRRCSSLIELELSGNRIVNIDEVAYLIELRKLVAHNNRIVSLPRNISKMVSLNILELNGNRIEILPESFILLFNLKVLNVSDNLITKFPEGFDALKNLTQLDISNNRITYVPQLSSGMLKMRKLNMNFNQIRVISPQFLGQLPKLRELFLRKNLLSSLDRELSTLSCLTLLDLSFNQLEVLYFSLGNLQNLIELDLSYNNFSEVPDGLKNLTSLHYANLGFNQLHHLGMSLTSMYNLMELHLGYNAHRIEVVEFCQLKFLKELTLARCYNASEFFPNICKLELLEELHMTDCNIETIPSYFAELENLRVLDVSSNRLQSLPAEIFEMYALEEFNASSNLIAQIGFPSSPARGVYDVDFSNNRLEDLPQFFQKWLAKCRKLKLARNRLSALPEYLFSLRHLNFISAEDNPLDYTRILPKDFLSRCVLDDRFLNMVPEVTGIDLAEGRSNYLIGWCEMNGRRPAQEDAISVVLNFCGNPNQYLLSIFDGHGDASAAEFIAINYHAILRECLKTHKTEDTEDILRVAFAQTQIHIKKQNIFSGATVISCLISGDRLYIANAGDARAVLCHDGMAIRLSKDHKPDDPEEMDRIRKLGGFVCNNRTNGVLAVSRSLGDFESQPFVTYDPYILKRTLTVKDTFVVLGCDGVWDVMTDQEVVDLVLNDLRQTSKLDERFAFRLAAKIRDAAYLAGSTDNISVVVAFFPSNLEHCRRIRPLSLYGKRTLKIKRK